LIFAYLLLLLIPIAAAAYLVWNHQRKTLQRDAASVERLQTMLGVAPEVPRTQPVQPPADATAAAPANAIAGAAISYSQRERLLSPPQTLLYYLLRSGLPDHLVFPQMTLASVLETSSAVAAHARTEMSRRLALHTVDFVISDRRMKSVAVIKLNSAADKENNEVSSMHRWLAEADVRYIELEAEALPRKDAIRSVVLGEAAAPGALPATAAM
jgi:hypothetical protein